MGTGFHGFVCLRSTGRWSGGADGRGGQAMVLARFLPRDEQFFDYFREAATNAAEVARVLVEVIEQGDEIERRVRRLRDLEHRGDEITHRVFNALNDDRASPAADTHPARAG